MTLFSQLIVAGSIGIVLSGCQTPGSPPVTTKNVMNQVYEDGQLFCANPGGNTQLVVGILNSLTGRAFTVTGKSALAVAAVCTLAGSRAVPVVPPVDPTMVPVVAVAVPAKLGS